MDHNIAPRIHGQKERSGCDKLAISAGFIIVTVKKQNATHRISVGRNPTARLLVGDFLKACVAIGSV